MPNKPTDSDSSLMAVDHPRLVRPLPKSGEADCPQCGSLKSVCRHNSDWTCHKCGYLETVDDDREAETWRKDAEAMLRQALRGLRMGADLAWATETTDSQHRMASGSAPRISGIEENVKEFLSRSNDELCQPCPLSTPPRQETADGQGLA